MQNQPDDDYRAARRRAQRFVSEQNSQGRSGYLPIFNAPDCSLYELPLGTLEVPLSKIGGTYTAGRQQAFAGNFMPLLDMNTEFALKWAEVNKAHLTEGLRDPIKAYEYMGFIYVLEGNKRVSVLTYHNAYSVRADLMRLLPERNRGDDENSVFYEFIDFDRRYIFKHMWFSKPGRFTGLRSLAALYEEKHAELEPGWLEFDFFRFRKAYHRLGYRTLPMTTGDAFWEFVQLFGFPNEVTDRELAARIRHCEPQFKFALRPDTDTADMPIREKRPGLFGLFAKTEKLTVGFALEGSARGNSFAHKHYVGQRALLRHNMVDTIVETGFPKGGEAYKQLSGLAAKKPDILFLTDPSWELPAARLTLENPECMVLHCCGVKPQRLQATYYGFTAAPAFLAGVLAGTLSRSGVVGYMKPDAESGALEGDAWAFANGARLIRSNIRVLNTNDDSSDTEILRMLARADADIVWRPVRGINDGKNVFVGLYAKLCGLDLKGNITNTYAGACWDWGVFYEMLAEHILQGSPEPLALAYAENNIQMEQSGGLLELCAVPRALGENPMRLLSMFTELAGDPRSSVYGLLREKTELEYYSGT